MGVWIETYFVTLTYDNVHVTPCVGVWIETYNVDYWDGKTQSHPAWVCGLKQPAKLYKPMDSCHTLRGCVD